MVEMLAQTSDTSVKFADWAKSDLLLKMINTRTHCRLSKIKSQELVLCYIYMRHYYFMLSII